MSDSLKAWLTSAAALLAIVGVAWQHIEPLATWLIANAGIVLARPMVQAVLTSICVGVLLAGTVPYIPLRAVREWAPDYTKAVTRGVCVLLTIVCTLVLANPQSDVEWRTDGVYALLAAGCASALWTTLAGLLYRVAPKPESLK